MPGMFSINEIKYTLMLNKTYFKVEPKIKTYKAKSNRTVMTTHTINLRDFTKKIPNLRQIQKMAEEIFKVEIGLFKPNKLKFYFLTSGSHFRLLNRQKDLDQVYNFLRRELMDGELNILVTDEDTGPLGQMLSFGSQDKVFNEEINKAGKIPDPHYSDSKRNTWSSDSSFGLDLVSEWKDDQMTLGFSDISSIKSVLPISDSSSSTSFNGFKIIPASQGNTHAWDKDNRGDKDISNLPFGAKEGNKHVRGHQQEDEYFDDFVVIK